MSFGTPSIVCGNHGCTKMRESQLETYSENFVFETFDNFTHF